MKKLKIRNRGLSISPNRVINIDGSGASWNRGVGIVSDASLRGGSVVSNTRVSSPPVSPPPVSPAPAGSTFRPSGSSVVSPNIEPIQKHYDSWKSIGYSDSDAMKLAQASFKKSENMKVLFDTGGRSRFSDRYNAGSAKDRDQYVEDLYGSLRRNESYGDPKEVNDVMTNLIADSGHVSIDKVKRYHKTFLDDNFVDTASGSIKFDREKPPHTSFSNSIDFNPSTGVFKVASPAQINIKGLDRRNPKDNYVYNDLFSHELGTHMLLGPLDKAKLGDVPFVGSSIKDKVVRNYLNTSSEQLAMLSQWKNAHGKKGFRDPLTKEEIMASMIDGPKFGFGNNAVTFGRPYSKDFMRAMAEQSKLIPIVSGVAATGLASGYMFNDIDESEEE